MKTDYSVGDLIYDANIYDGLNTSLDDLEFYLDSFPRDKKNKILELCCGTGRLTLPIAQAGYSITGVDMTPSMLEKAKIKAHEAGLDIEYIEGDMRNLDLHMRYDIVFIPFNSIHHLYTNEDLIQTLKVVKKHLKKGGIFLMDCYNPNISLIAEGEKGFQEIAHYTTSDGRAIQIKQLMRYESKSQINRIEWHYKVNGNFDSVQNLDMRMYFPQELDFYLQSCGFKIRNKFGNFEGDAFQDSSEKQVFICTSSEE